MKLWKKIVIGLSAFVIANAVGCKNVVDKADDLAAKHDAALVSADSKLAHADGLLGSIPNPPSQVTDARKDIAGAKGDINSAQGISKQLHDLAKGVAQKNEKLEHEFFSPVQKKIFVGVGITIALIGLAIVLLRFGGGYGFIASLPIIGAVIAKIGFLKPSEKSND